MRPHQDVDRVELERRDPPQYPVEMPPVHPSGGRRVGEALRRQGDPSSLGRREPFASAHEAGHGTGGPCTLGPRSPEVRASCVVADPLDIHVPAVIDRGDGARFTDVDGNAWLDFSGGLGCQLVGYSHPKVVEAVQRQAAKVSHTDFSVIPYEPYVELAERLIGLTGGGGRKAAFFNAGAEA